MGNDNSNPKQQSGQNNAQKNNRNSQNLRFIFKEIDNFYVTELNKLQFTDQLFSEIQKYPNPLIGNVKISKTFILERLYCLLTNVHSKISQNLRSKGVNCRQLKDFVETIYKNPEKAIESKILLILETFQMIDVDQDKFIGDAQFLNYMDNSFISLMAAAEKQITDNHFKVALKDWVSKNKKPFYQEILRTFQQYKRTDPKQWTYSDFKRWILSGENWTIDISLGGKTYRTPINLLCLFGIPKPVL